MARRRKGQWVRGLRTGAAGPLGFSRPERFRVSVILSLTQDSRRGCPETANLGAGAVGCQVAARRWEGPGLSHLSFLTMFESNCAGHTGAWSLSSCLCPPPPTLLRKPLPILCPGRSLKDVVGESGHKVPLRTVLHPQPGSSGSVWSWDGGEVCGVSGLRLCVKGQCFQHPGGEGGTADPA